VYVCVTGVNLQVGDHKGSSMRCSEPEGVLLLRDAPAVCAITGAV